jgi:hypothetical protein
VQDAVDAVKWLARQRNSQVRYTVLLLYKNRIRLRGRNVVRKKDDRNRMNLTEC